MISHFNFISNNKNEKLNLELPFTNILNSKLIGLNLLFFINNIQNLFIFIGQTHCDYFIFGLDRIEICISRQCVLFKI
eukprot:UN19126